MIFYIQAVIRDGVLVNELIKASNIYDPKGLLSKYEGKCVDAKLHWKVSKKGNFVAILQDIKEI